MNSRRSFLAFSLGAVAAAGSRVPEATVIEAPGGGIQPQAAVDSSGTIHLIYLYGDPAAADIAYVYKAPGQREFSSPVRVNSQAGSAVALGTVRGPHIAIGHSGVVHVAWNGSVHAEPKAAQNSAPMLYACMRDDRKGFEPQRNVMRSGAGLDGGGTVTADPFGHVYVAWHSQGALEGEGHRRVWLARSRDHGRTFDPAVPISPERSGACGCCGISALADDHGNVYLIYRGAREIVHRDEYLLVSRDRGTRFAAFDLQPWEIGACPMSTASLYRGNRGTLAAWETNHQVYCAHVDPTGVVPASIIQAPGQGLNRKHPAIAMNNSGQILMAWTEGTGWKKGGSLHWTVFDDQGHPIAGSGERPPIRVPVWSAPAVITVKDRFVVIC